ncbi:MAG: aminoglycoside phosphotransferase family protein [Anaerolineales bacterium]|nr:aminoglycoside phosphotransferase family protein [Anaerolineales bacterium]
MPPNKLHADEVFADEALVRRLLAAQFPHWADLPLRPVASAGTDHALYRLGAELVVRLPRIHWAIGQAEKERQWLPRLAPHLPLALPAGLAHGRPGAGYPWTWSVYRWLAGVDAASAPPADLSQAARDLAAFLRALQGIDPAGGPPAVDHGLRGAPLARRDAATRQAIAALAGLIDTETALAAWEAALRAPDWDRPPVWFHGDLLPGNLLVERGRLSAVIDFGGLGVGDPACDLMSAWSLFTGASRAVFRAALEVDDATWARGRGQALSQAVIFIPYYRHTNPAGVQLARRAVAAVLADFQENR